MKKLAIPAMLATIVLVAGLFAILPVDKAATVHTSSSIASNMQSKAAIVEVTSPLHDFVEDRDSDGATDQFTYVVSDTSPKDMRTVHVALTLEVDGDDDQDCTADGGESITLALASANELDILVGDAGGFNNVLDTESKVEAALVPAAGSPVRTTDAGDNAMCVLHVDVSPTGTATDVVVKKPTDTGNMESDSAITVTISEFA